MQDEGAWLQGLTLHSEQAASDRGSPVDRARSLATRGLLRQVLAEVGVAKAARIDRTLFGAPTTVGWSISASHSGDQLTAAALPASAGTVGIDVEQRRPIDVLALSARVCTAKERAAVGGSAERFLRVWTAKEAFAKATGLGLAVGAKNVEVDLCGEPVSAVGIRGSSQSRV